MSTQPYEHEIRRGDVADIARIGEIDRTEDVDVEYVCKLSGDGKAIQRFEERHDPPRHIPPWDEEGIRRRSRWWTRELDNGGAIFVVERQDRLIGIAAASPERARGVAEIVSLFVDSEHRGRGLGRRLLRALEEEAASRGIHSLYVGSNENAGSVAFYQKMGFRITCMMDPSVLWIPGLETTIVLAKNLESQATRRGM